MASTSLESQGYLGKLPMLDGGKVAIENRKITNRYLLQFPELGILSSVFLKHPVLMSIAAKNTLYYNDLLIVSYILSADL